MGLIVSVFLYSRQTYTNDPQDKDCKDMKQLKRPFVISLELWNAVKEVYTVLKSSDSYLSKISSFIVLLITVSMNANGVSASGQVLSGVTFFIPVGDQATRLHLDILHELSSPGSTGSEFGDDQPDPADATHGYIRHIFVSYLHRRLSIHLILTVVRIEARLTVALNFGATGLSDCMVEGVAADVGGCRSCSSVIMHYDHDSMIP